MNINYKKLCWIAVVNSKIDVSKKYRVYSLFPPAH